MRLFVCICISVLLSSCATNKQLIPMGGSKSDGVVHMSYDVASYEQPIVDWRTAGQQALRVCESWGYTHAQPFGGQTTRCIEKGRFGCDLAQVTVNYQCIGSKTEATSNSSTKNEPVMDKSQPVAIEPKQVTVKMQTITVYDKPGF